MTIIRKREKKIHSDGKKERGSQEKRKQEGRGRLESQKELSGHCELSIQCVSSAFIGGGHVFEAVQPGAVTVTWCKTVVKSMTLNTVLGLGQ